MKIVQTLVVALALGAASTAPASAVDYTGDGRVSMGTAAYDGPGVSPAEWSGIGAATVGLVFVYQATPVIALGAAPASAIAYGAWRTSKHRAQDVKDLIHKNLDAKRREARPGTVREVLGR